MWRRIVQSKKFVSLVVILLLFITSCGGNKERKGETCAPGVYIEGHSGSTIQLQEGKINTLVAQVNTCKLKDKNFTYSWYLDDGDQPVSSTNKYDYISCKSDVGTHKLKIVAASIDSNIVLQKTYTVKVIEVPNPPKPSCYGDAMNTVRTGYVQGFTSAVSCLENYLKEYVCDVDANFAAGLGKEVLFLMSIENLYNNHTSLTEKDIKSIGDNTIMPMVNHFKVVMEKAPKDWSFFEEGLYDIVVFDGKERYMGKFDISLHGEFDLGEIYFLVSQASAMEGGYYMATAFNGLLDHFLKVPFDFSIQSEIKRFVGKMIDDPKFLTFAGRDGQEGKENLLLARGAFIDSVHLIQEMFAEIKSETDDQSDDLLRYWDCGSDAICPPASECPGGASWIDPVNGDPPEYDPNKYSSCQDAGNDYDDRNHNGQCDEGWQKTGPDKDGTECNNKYDDGEPLGTEILGFPDFKVINIASDLSQILIAQNEIELSLIGPDHPLDFDRMAGMQEGTVKSAMDTMGLPYPEVRLSEVFLTPTEARLLVPLYSISKRYFIIDNEYEPFKDTGYDGCTDKYEDGNGGCVSDPSLSPYDPIKDPDPNHDDIDLSCAPTCNQNDGYDNDGDGCIDEDNHTKFGNVPGDIGAEGNLVFDFIDENGNGKHDSGEKSEPFEDIGINGVPGSAGNGKWDTKDMTHTWPNGSDVGPVTDVTMTDPRDGCAPYDPEGELIDFYYLFFPDPTFSRFLILDWNHKNIDNEDLNDHAKLHRFVSKAFDLLQQVGIYDNGVHKPCK